MPLSYGKADCFAYGKLFFGAVLGMGTRAVVGNSALRSKTSLESEPTAILGVFVFDCYCYWNSFDILSLDMMSSL